MAIAHASKTSSIADKKQMVDLVNSNKKLPLLEEEDEGLVMKKGKGIFLAFSFEPIVVRPPSYSSISLWEK